MTRRIRAARAWSRPAPAPAPSSTLTGDASSDGATRRGAPSARFAFRISSLATPVPPKKPQPADVAVTIRGSLEVPRLNYEPEEEDDVPLVGLDAAAGDAECAAAAGKSVSWCRSAAVTFTIVLLLRHLVTVVTIGAANQYAFGLLTVYLLRASGILLPFYVVMRLISAIQQGQKQYRLLMLQAKRIKNAQAAGRTGAATTACNPSSLSKGYVKQYLSCTRLYKCTICSGQKKKECKGRIIVYTHFYFMFIRTSLAHNGRKLE
ncbi:hypothetical protein EJB05_30868 [Eragrostis curvula]|uniref:Uncharacterized protein n=1 Tax=Eragrostis curvula TaxID=38414 RepID=A0A5J9UC42_9POAL|nr:hypothetical protein EJB05_30868 [Eragrostis curvula]